MKTPNHIAVIVAADERNAIGKNGALLCHLPNDLKHFKRVTEHHTIVMGRRTFESLPKGALPNRTNIVLTRDKNLSLPGAIVCHSLDEVWRHRADDETMFFIGGGQIYKKIINQTHTLYLTRVHHIFDDADTFFPDINYTNWKLIEKDARRADEKHPYDYTFLTYARKEKK